jgi:hypothetical protein
MIDFATNPNRSQKLPQESWGDASNNNLDPHVFNITNRKNGLSLK